MMRNRQAALLILPIAAMMLIPAAARAEVITVGSGGDHTTVTAAVAAAASGDVIDIFAGTYTEIGISVDKNLTIQGNGARDTILQAAATPGSDAGRIFDSIGATVVLQNLTIQNGSSSTAGGAIAMSTGTLEAYNVTFKDNETTSNQDGGVLEGAPSAFVTVENCLFEGNSADDDGGVFGKKIDSLVIRNSTFSGNTAGAGDPSVLYAHNGGPVEITNSTFVGNGDTGNSKVIMGNTSSQVTVESCLFMDNDGFGDADVTNVTYSISDLVDDLPDHATNHDGVVPSLIALGALADNGGQTDTHALGANSFAIDKGSNPAGLANDQRGPGYPRAVGQTDVGAFEVPEPATVGLIALGGVMLAARGRRRRSC